MISPERRAAIIRTKMAEKGVRNQKELARAVGILPSTLSGYFSGKQMFTLQALYRICTFLGMSQEERGALLM